MVEKTLIPYIHRIAKLGAHTGFVYHTEFRRYAWTYRELYEMGLRVAVWLRLQGCRKGDRILVWAGNSPELVALFLGAIRAGVVWVPLDIHSEMDFVEKVREETEARLVFLSKLHRHHSFPIPAFLVEDLEKIFTAISQESLPEQKAAIDPDDLVEILYTSGTTAQPKGVMLTHKNLVSDLEPILALQGTVPWDKFLTLVPMSHAFAQMVGFFVPLFRGYRLVILENLKASLVERVIEQEKITTVVLVPGLLKMMQDLIERKISSLRWKAWYELPIRCLQRLPLELRLVLGYPFRWVLTQHVRTLVVGGAALSPEMEKYWNDLGILIVQGYGLTEAAPVVACNNVLERRFGSVGRVLSNVEVRFAEDGEILVHGSNVTPGYFKRAKETAELFEGDWLKTGDVGTIDSDGYLYIKERKKDLIIKPDGLNIYPSDIEDVLAHIPGVRDSCVLGLDKKGNVEVHAVLLLERGYENPGEIVKSANEKLQGFQKIESFTVWPEEDFPRAVTLKVKKAEVENHLVKELSSRTGREHGSLPAVTESKINRILAQITKRALGEIKPEARLGTDLNLSSIEKVELVSCLEEETGRSLDESLIQDSTTVAEIEHWLEERVPLGERYAYVRWTQKPWGRVVRWLAQNLIAFPVVRFFVRVNAEGLDRLAQVKGPVIFASNHLSHLDAPAVMLALPPGRRGRLAPAAWQEFFEEPLASPGRKMLLKFLYYLCTVCFNIFLFPKRAGFRKSLLYAGELADQGTSILFFPEGERSRSGRMAPFQEGIGMLVSKLKIPVVPVRVKGSFELMPRTQRIPKRGNVTVTFGWPMVFDEETFAEIAKRVEEEVGKL